MSIQPAQLDALVAVVEQGTFDAAARRLHVTPSAVSQRIRALESTAGQVLVQRSTPCRATPAGEALLRLARQIRLLHDEADRALGGDRQVVDLPVAVNADSLATWMRPILHEVGAWEGAVLRLHVEDQAFSADLLRRGEVLAAVTSDPSPVQGCLVERLGALRYTPAAAPWFADRWRRGRSYDWARMPVVVFNEKDALQHGVLAARGVTAPPVAHRVPTSHDFHEAVRAGLGWASIPDPQLLPDVEAGRLVVLAPRAYVDVELHWQRWRLDSPSLDRLSALVLRAARVGLRGG
ncbi:MAG: LysR family transcriptional regulator ArgP [Actinomycetota bacterium]|nr:LysR family transcriptional regulator ArgP [Actinomycetota bacterium]